MTEGKEPMIGKHLMFVLACILVVLAGCESTSMEKTSKSNMEDKEINDITEKETPDHLEEDHQSKEETLPLAEEEEVVDSYQMKTAIYEKGSLSIQYPQLMQMVDRDKELQLNERLKQDGINYITQFEDDDIPLNMKYQVIENSQDRLSILYTGHYNGGMYPTHLLFTTNLNIKEGKKIKISDVYPINEKFLEQFRQSSYIDWENPTSPNTAKQEAVVDYLNSMNQQELINAFKSADDPSIEDNPYGIYSYYKEDFLIISIQVPHALGDHAEFKINLE